MPLGWQANEDWERGVGFSSDKRFRLIVWRVDFAYEGVNDAEHYAATKTGAIKARKPGIQAQARKLGDGTFLIVYQNVPAAQGDAEPRVVFDLVVPQAGQAKGGRADDPGRAGARFRSRPQAHGTAKVKAQVDW